MAEMSGATVLGLGSFFLAVGWGPALLPRELARRWMRSGHTYLPRWYVGTILAAAVGLPVWVWSALEPRTPRPLLVGALLTYALVTGVSWALALWLVRQPHFVPSPSDLAASRYVRGTDINMAALFGVFLLSVIGAQWATRAPDPSLNGFSVLLGVLGLMWVGEWAVRSRVWTATQGENGTVMSDAER